MVRHAWMRGVDQALGTNRTPPPPPSTWPQMRVSEMGAICEDHLDLVVREGCVVNHAIPQPPAPIPV